VDTIGPSSPKSVRKLDKGRIVVLEEPPASRVKLSSKTKKPFPNLSTKRKIQISEKRRKKQSSGSDAGEIAYSVPEVIVELPQEKVGELEKTSELRIKGKKKLRINEESVMVQSSSRKKKISAQEEKILVPTSESSRRKTRKPQEKQIPMPISEPKKKKRKLFEEENSIPISKPDEASCLACKTTWSKAK
jgi:hypothetical protein